MDGDALPAAVPGAPWTWQRASRHAVLLVVLLVLLIVGLRMALPYWVKHIVNGRIATMGDYHGEVRDIDLHLWRGAYGIDGLVITKRSGKVPVPFVDAPLTEISLSWREILHGELVGEVVFERPQINFVDGLGSSDGQTGAGVDWRRQLQELVPIKLNEVQVHDGTVAFRAFKTDPPVDMEATNLDATILNLTNVREKSGGRVATFSATANVLGQAPLDSHAAFDPLGSLDDFAFDIKVLEIEAVRLNQLLQAYANLDVVSGRGDFVMELEATKGALSGYAKPLFTDLDVLNWEQDVKEQRDNPLRLAWEALAGSVLAVFKNHPADRFATRIPITGNLNDPKLSSWEALVAILRNTLVKAFQPHLEGAGDR